MVDKLWFDQNMERQGLSLRAVARQMGIDAGALSRSLNSKRKLKPEEIKQLADILEQPAAKVLEHVNAAAGASSALQPKGFGEMKQADIKHDAKPAPLVAKSEHHPAYGALKGMITLLPGVDYTEPADPDWGKVYDD